jgi:hypothetical protein
VAYAAPSRLVQRFVDRPSHAGRKHRRLPQPASATMQRMRAIRRKDDGMPQHSCGLERHVVVQHWMQSRRRWRIRVCRPCGTPPHWPSHSAEVTGHELLESRHPHRRVVIDEIRTRHRNPGAAGTPVRPAQHTQQTQAWLPVLNHRSIVTRRCNPNRAITTPRNTAPRRCRDHQAESDATTSPGRGTRCRQGVRIQPYPVSYLPSSVLTVDHTWQNPNRIPAVQGLVVTVLPV